MNCPCCIMVNGTHDPRCPNGYTFSPVKNGKSGVVTTAANVRNVTPGARECAEYILSNCAEKYARPDGYSFPPQMVIEAMLKAATERVDAYRSQVLNEAIEKVDEMPRDLGVGGFSDQAWNKAIEHALAVLREMKG